MPRSGTGRIYKRGSVYWIDYSFRGRRYRESSDSAKKKDAADLLKRRMGEMGRGTLVGPAEEKVTFEDLAAMIETDYAVNDRSSKAQLKSTLKRLRTHFALSLAVDITTDRIKAYIQAQQEEGYANGTIRKDLAALKRAFNLAVQARRLSSRPYIPGVKVDNARKGFLTAADVDAVCREIGEDLAPLVRFAALTGWRRSEVRSLTWAQVDFDAGTVRLEPGTTKNSEGRTFPFRALPPLARLLEAQWERTRAIERKRGEIVAHVFHRDGEPIRSFRRAWNAATRRAGIEGYVFHDLRRTAVRNLEKAGVPRSVAMKLTGHKTEAVYRRYAIANEKDLAEGVEKLAKVHEGSGEGRSVVPIEGARQA